MGIPAQPELFPLPASFFPIPAAVPEEHADVIRFQHDEPVAFGFEAKTKEVAVERDRDLEVRNLKQDVIELMRVWGQATSDFRMTGGSKRIGPERDAYRDFSEGERR